MEQSQVKVRDILENHSTYRIFVDLDGVLADFEKHARETLHVDPHATDKESVNQLFKKLDQYQLAGGKYFEHMPPMPDAMHLWNYIKEYNPTICSAIGRIAHAQPEKQAWVRQHLGSKAATSALFVPAAKEKMRYAGPNHILIDDKMKAIAPWKQAGGIGILHTSAATTIEKLKELGL